MKMEKLKKHSVELMVLVVVLVMVVYSCKKDDVVPASTPTLNDGVVIVSNDSSYFGCWTDVLGTRHDMMIDKHNDLYRIRYGDDCVVDTLFTTFTFTFRNDTGIIDTSYGYDPYEYWIYLEGDTLLQDSYAPTTNPYTRYVRSF